MRGMTNRITYMRTYMAKRRAENPTSRIGKREAGLKAILSRLEGNDAPLAVEISAIARDALAS